MAGIRSAEDSNVSRGLSRDTPHNTQCEHFGRWAPTLSFRVLALDHGVSIRGFQLRVICDAEFGLLHEAASQGCMPMVTSRPRDFSQKTARKQKFDIYHDLVEPVKIINEN
jgi:hypothetical protein